MGARKDGIHMMLIVTGHDRQQLIFEITVDGTSLRGKIIFSNIVQILCPDKSGYFSKGS